jgi:hypothetical protein
MGAGNEGNGLYPERAALLALYDHVGTDAILDTVVVVK